VDARYNNKRVNFHNSTIQLPVDVYEKGTTVWVSLDCSDFHVQFLYDAYCLYKIICSFRDECSESFVVT